MTLTSKMSPSSLRSEIKWLNHELKNYTEINKAREREGLGPVFNGPIRIAENRLNECERVLRNKVCHVQRY